MMAALDCFDVCIEGTGAHGALPHRGVDPVATAALAIGALQTIVSRNADPLKAAVVSVTKVHAGDTYNIIPDRARFGGGIRCFDPALREKLKTRLCEVVEGVAAACGARAAVEFVSAYPPVLNDERATATAAAAAAEVAGSAAVEAAAQPLLVSEDFSYMLEKRPGCFLFIGNGDGPGSCMVHNPGYDFNDDILAVGASYWVRLARNFLAAERA
jgi:hippurate hydrolase